MSQKCSENLNFWILNELHAHFLPYFDNQHIICKIFFTFISKEKRKKVEFYSVENRSGSCFSWKLDPDPGQLHPAPQPCVKGTVHLGRFHQDISRPDLSLAQPLPDPTFLHTQISLRSEHGFLVGSDGWIQRSNCSRLQAGGSNGQIVLDSRLADPTVKLF